MSKTGGHKIVASNRKARHDYLIEDTFEAGLVLTGSIAIVKAVGTDDAGQANRPAGAEAILHALAASPMATVGAGGAEGEADPYAGMEVSRNAPCPCGSGNKYKHCHGAA